MSKAKVALVTDSTAYLPADFVQKYNIHVIPLIVNWAGESLYDNVDISAAEFYTRLTKAKEMPSTSQPSVGEFHAVFSKAAEEAESIVCIVISGELSGTLASATAAKELMGDFPIEIVDSRSASMALGFMALAAARVIAEGADHVQAAQIARDMTKRMNIVFVVDTLEFLHRGGRIGGAQRLFGSVLSIKPVLQLEDGRIEPLNRVRTKKKALNYLLDLVEERMRGQNKVHIGMLHAVSPAEAEFVGKELQQRLNPTEMIYTEISPVIGTHVGPGAIGVAFYAE